MRKIFRISAQLVNCRVASRVRQTACTHTRNWSNKDENRNVINITRIYNDEDGNSHFGTMEIELKSSGEDIYE